MTSAESLLRHATIGTRLGTSLIVASLAAVALAALVTGPLAPFLSRDLDAPASRYFLAQSPAGATVFRNVGALGNPAVAATIMIALCTIIGIRTHTWTPLFTGAAALCGAIVITSVARLTTSRSRAYGPIDGFPSGHAMTAASVFGSLALLAASSSLPRHIKRLAIVLGVTLPLAVAWSRLALLDHVPSDVIGGLLLGAAWAATVNHTIRTPQHPRQHARTPHP